LGESSTMQILRCHTSGCRQRDAGGPGTQPARRVPHAV